MRAANLTCSTLLLLVMSVPATIATAQTGNAASPPLGKLIDVGGYRVHLYCAGNGGPPVIIAGGGYSFDWGLIQPEVAKFTEVCAMTIPALAGAILARRTQADSGLMRYTRHCEMRGLKGLMF